MFRVCDRQMTSSEESVEYKMQKQSKIGFKRNKLFTWIIRKTKKIQKKQLNQIHIDHKFISLVDICLFGGGIYGEFVEQI